jgi:predicted nicotinamide N-methyase
MGDCTGAPGVFTEGWETVFDAADRDGSAHSTGSLGINFVQASLPEFKVTLPASGVILPVKQELSSGLGAVVWQCGVALSQLIDLHPALVRGKAVLELGSGTGLVGIVAAVSGAASTILTDLPELQTLLADNCALCATACEQGDLPNRVVIADFTWGTERPQPLRGKCDVVIVSDALYDERIFPLFLHAIKEVLGQDTVLLMSYKKRLASREIAFFTELAEVLQMRVAPKEALDPELQEAGVYLIRATRRPDSDSIFAASPAAAPQQSK